MLTRAVTTRKPWVCDECGTRQPAGTVAHWRRAGRWVRGSDGTVYGDVRLCDACAWRVATGRGDELRTEAP